MESTFVIAFEEARDGLSIPRIASEMAKRLGKSESGLSGNLYRLINSNQLPTKQTVIDIAETLSDLRNLSAKERKKLNDRLLTAARPDDAHADLRRELRSACEKVLRKVSGLTEYDISGILDRADTGTMKLILDASEKGEPIVPMRLPMEPGTDIAAGRRAKIHVDGEISPAQRRLLEKAAEMIEAVLQV